MTIHRQTGTDVHARTRKMLDKLHFAYEEEWSVHPYFLDFYLTEFKIGVEADSAYWHVAKNDVERDAAILTTYQIPILRCTLKTKLHELELMVVECLAKMEAKNE